MNPEFGLKLLLIMVLLGTIPNCFCQNYETCMLPFSCGDVREMGYPFWGSGRPPSCGYPGFQLTCRDNSTLHLNISSVAYRVLNIDFSATTLTVSREDLSNNLCAPLHINTTLDHTLFDFSPIANDQNMTLFYGCGLGRLPSKSPYRFDCGNRLNSYSVAGEVSNVSTMSCNSSITVPVSQSSAQALSNPATSSRARLEEALSIGFSVSWYADNARCYNCVQSGGLCGRNQDAAGGFACFCSNGNRKFTCHETLTGTIPSCFCQNYASCNRTVNCGAIRGLLYPFWGQGRHRSCGFPGFHPNCRNNNTLILNISSVTYRVLNIDYTANTLRLSRDDLSNTLCAPLLTSTTFDPTFFNYSSTANDRNITLFYNCSLGQIPSKATPPYRFNCGNSLNSYSVEGEVSSVNNMSCDSNITVPVSGSLAAVLARPETSSLIKLEAALAIGFSVRWYADNAHCYQCFLSGGLCGRNPDLGKFVCYCRNGNRNFTCNDAPTGGGTVKRRISKMNIGLPIGIAVIVGVGLGCLVFYLRQRKKKLHQRLGSQLTQSTSSKEITTPMSSNPLSMPPPPTGFRRNIPSFMTSNSDLGRGSTYFGVRVFDYTELEEATNNFDSSRILGDGGFGTVYYGVLSDGQIVAVKRLYENNFKRVEQFMNEVQILTRLRHENLVTLYGCTSKRSHELLLVYEYISNGTVADHLHGKKSETGLLSWPIRLNIAIETAEALNYLHRSDIIHRDVKTNNILLDDNFHVKVADFGLSRLFPADATHVSTAPQGTPGYVDPEYYQCYQLTEKSDVYSFGVVLAELISSLQAVDMSRLRHNINLANMTVNKIQNRALNELVDLRIGFETDPDVKRMATLVAELAFRCLQHERDMRPSMEEVLEGLKGIRSESLIGESEELFDILLVESDDEVGPLTRSVGPPSLSSVATEKSATESAPNCSE